MGCKGICSRYKAVKPVGSRRYESGQVRCMPCQTFLIWDKLFCPCCGTRVRTKPRNAKYKFLFQGIRTDSNVKAVYHGSGKDPKLKPVIDAEYLKLVPRVSMEKYEEMKNSILQNGMREPASLNKNGIVLDGHTRYSICSELQIPFPYDVKLFENPDEEKKYVITSNLERRQLTPYQMVELSQNIRQIYIKENKEIQKEHLSLVKRGMTEKTPLKDRLKKTTSYRMAELLSLGTTTIDKSNYIFDHGTPEEKETASSGEESLESIYKKIVNRRHADPDVTKRNGRVFPTCPKCGSDTRFKGKCHVHSHYCCRKCNWGN